MKNNVQENDKIKEGLHWFDNKRNIKLVIYALYVICAALFLAEFFYYKHAVFSFDTWFGFYAIYGFIMCVGLVIGVKVIRLLLIRRENYYDSSS